MAKDMPLLTSTAPTRFAPARVHIGHVQLRDLIICPRERGVVNYVEEHSIVEHNISAPDSTPRTLAELTFTPNTLTSLQVPGTDYTLLAAGGQEAEIHLSLHAPKPHATSSCPRHRHPLWQFEASLPGSINNSVLLTSLSLTRSNESSAEPRVGISNNDNTVKFYDVPIRRQTPPAKLLESGTLRLDVPVNHSSISPDGRTLLSVGDSPKVYLHHMTGGSRVTFSPIATLHLPPADVSPLNYSSSLAASFSTAFSSNGTKFAVASQEGIVVVWDVRSSKPLKIFQTDKSRLPKAKAGISNTGGEWMSDDPWEWTRGNSKAPGWSVRNVKFGHGGTGGYEGKETMTFTEHTSFLHVVDARTFETEEIIRVPNFSSQPPPLRHIHPTHSHVRTPRASTSSPRPSQSLRYINTATASPSSRPPGYSPMIVLALEDTFRISSSPTDPSTSNTVHWRTSPSRLRGLPEDDVVVIPPLGDREVEDDVRALLGHHGIRARHSEDNLDERVRRRERDELEYVASGHGTRGDDEMEVDELESDCLSSHTPSRSSSPSPSTHIPVQASPARLSSVAPPQGPSTWSSRLRCDEGESEEESETDLDLAGLCYDPTGGFVYIATTDGVGEWSVRGAEKRWWAGNEWK